MENIFENRKTSQMFYNILMKFKDVERKEFSRCVRALFDRKVTSEEGEFDSFKINIGDFEYILSEMGISPTYAMGALKK